MRLEGKQVTVTMPDGQEMNYTMNLPVREHDRVYIIGCATTKDMVPYDDKEAEFWGVNNLYGVPLPGARFTRWFEIHNIWFDQQKRKLVRRELTDFRGQPVEAYMKGLAALNIPCYMQQFWPDLVPNSVPYPLQEVINFFGKEKGYGNQIARYFTNTISYEIGLAIFEGFKEIEVWGVDMAVGSEYQNQRPSCEFWLGVAAGMGVKIHIPAEADLLKSRFLYGFEEPLQNEFTKKMKKLRTDMIAKLNSANNQLVMAQKTVEQYQGAIHAAQEIDKIWSNFDDKITVTAS